MASPLRSPLQYAKQKFESGVYSVMSKFGYPPFNTNRTQGHSGPTQPVYQREVSPDWLKQISEQHAIINNSIEEKVQQTFRRGFSPTEKKYEAKCPECQTEFGSLSRFKVDEDGEVDIPDEEVDLNTERPCPECGEMVEMKTPDPDKLDEIRSFFERANMRDKSNLVPDRHNSVSQTYLEVCREVAWDIQIFDDGWMIFERDYVLDSNGEVYDWELSETFRVPPQLMRYSEGENGKIGNEYYVCLECRAEDDDYQPEKSPGTCQHCGNELHEVYAYMLDGIRGDPMEYFVKGEFAHASEYRPRFTYGYSPILSVWQEARTLEQMDEWYQKAYEQRRAPRGAIVIRSSNAESIRAWNTEQMEKLNNDTQHIPTFIDDTEGNGDPIKWQPLLEDPAQMQHMQMREWFLDRISAKFGVTAVFQKGASQSSGMSQSLEIVVANRSMERLRAVFNDVFLPAFLGQIKAEGWTREVAPPEEEDDQSAAQLEGRHLNNLQVAQQLGLEAEWTSDDRANIKPGPIELQEDEGGMGGLGDLMGGGGEEPDGGGSGQTSPSGGRPEEANDMGGQPDSPDNPSTENPFNRADSSVTTGSGGYSNATYGGDIDEAEPEVYDYLEHIRSQLNDENDAEKRAELVDDAVAKWDEVDIGPDVGPLKTAAMRPDKSFQHVRRKYNGEWTQEYAENDLVRMMYSILEANEQ